MHYIEKEEYSHLIEENQIIHKVEENSDTINIYIKNKPRESTCPVCGHSSEKVVATYRRIIQDTPIRNKTVYLHITVNKYECSNDECEKKVFSEELTIAGKNQKRTYQLNFMILAIAASLSAKGAARILNQIGVKISHDAVRDLANSVTFEDDPDVEMIGIDDVAIRKGHSYGTVIYNLKTGEPLCLLSGRTEEDVIEWLKAHQNIKVVARDRASAYASAISKVLPNAIQIADRFHLFQNLTDVLEKKLKGKIPSEVYLDNGKVIDYKKAQSVFKTVKEEEIANLDYDSSDPLDSQGKKVKFIDSNKNKAQKSRKKELRQQSKIKKIIRVKNHYENTEGATINSTANKFHITFYTAKKYILMSEEEIKNLQVKKQSKKKESRDVKNIVYKMFQDNMKPSVIFRYIKSKNIYHGSDSSLRQLIYNFGHKNFPDLFMKEEKVKKHNKVNYEKLTRSTIFNLLLKQNPSSENEILRKQLIQKIPECRKIYEIFDDFHHTIMDGEIVQLDRFLDKYKKELSSFCRGIEKDRAAINQAISSKTSSGIVEGNNTKFKLVKRIVYGRCNLVNLEKKFLLYCRFDSGNYCF